MTDDRLQQIRDRFDAIIPGPWRWYGNTATDQVALATTNRGRLFIMDTHTRITEYVFDHDAGASYALDEARKRAPELWCPHHAHDVDPDDPGACFCDELRRFLRSRDNPEELGRAEMEITERGYRRSLTRGAQVHPDLRFPDKSLGDRRNEHGGHMRSYRDNPRYEVLGEIADGFFRGYRTREEYEAQTGKDHKNALYREDFIGLDQPEATFIERAPEDIGWLLEHVAELEAEIADQARRIEDYKDAL